MIEIKEKVNLANYTTFGIGGEAEYFVRVKGKNELIEALEWAKENRQKFFIIGGGSNLLVADNGVSGLVILNRSGEFKLDGEKVIADSGVNLSKIARETVDLGLSGLDFATGIPGTIGGAAAGNAGAYGKDMSKILVSAELWENGEITTYSNKDFNYAYRNSKLKGNNQKVILSVSLGLAKGDKVEMLASLEKDAAKRNSDYAGRNSGSYFTNFKAEELDDERKKALEPYTTYGKVVAGKLIDSLDLKGYKIGGAMVSEQNANVILNVENATARNVLDLERAIIDKVFSAYGVKLTPEVTKIGEF